MTSATDGLRIGFVPGVTLTKWRRVWAERFPRQPLEVIEISDADQRRALLDGSVDMCFVRRPIDVEDLHVIPLYDEVIVAWAAKEHPVAAFDEITLADLIDEDVRDTHDQVSIDAAVAEVAVLRVPMSVARTHNRRDLVHRPIVDAPPSAVGLAWLCTNEDPLIKEFIGVVRGRSPQSSRTANERKTRTPARPQPKHRGAKQAEPRRGQRRQGPHR
ncbi:MAG: LysR substrate-binding domain-containing protein [Tessaracoccus sp.]